MDTKFWGKNLWVGLHSIAHNYDSSKHDPESYKQFFYYLGEVLPCIHCRNSYKEFFKILPIEPYLESNQLHRWVYDIHNMVNQKLRDQGNILRDPSFEEVYDRYDKYRVKNCDKKLTCQGGGGKKKKKRCKGKTVDGSRCEREVSLNNKYCWQHK